GAGIRASPVPHALARCRGRTLIQASRWSAPQTASRSRLDATEVASDLRSYDGKLTCPCRCSGIEPVRDGSAMRLPLPRAPLLREDHEPPASEYLCVRKTGSWRSSASAR